MKQLRKLLTICGISILVWLLCIFFGHVDYETNDDAIINMIAAGAYGEPSQYLVYSGIILGYFLKLAYALLLGVNCYLWFYLVLNLLSVIVICHVISRDLALPGTLIVTALVNTILAKDLFINLQYTKNATVYAVAGFLLLFGVLGGGMKKVPGVIFSSILIMISSQVRKESFLFMLPFAAVALFAVVLQMKHNSNRPISTRHPTIRYWQS